MRILLITLFLFTCGCERLVSDALHGTFGHDCIQQGAGDTVVENQTGSDLRLTMYNGYEKHDVAMAAGEKVNLFGSVISWTEYGGVGAKFGYQDAKCTEGVERVRSIYFLDLEQARTLRNCYPINHSDPQVIVSISRQCPSGTEDFDRSSRESGKI